MSLSRRSQPPLAVSVPLSRATSHVGGGSAFYVSLLYYDMNTLNEIIKSANDGKIAGRPETELREMIKVCSCHASSPSWEGRQAQSAVDLILGEIARQQTCARHSVLVEGQKLLKGSVDTLVSGQSALKQSVDRLHGIDIAILIVGTIAAISGVILLFLKR